MTAQVPLPLPPLRARPVGFVVGSGNSDALSRIDAWRDAPRTRPLDWVMLLLGPPRGGKTTLLEHVAGSLGAPVRGADLDIEAMLEGPARPVLVDDAQAFDPLDLFALIEGQAGRRALLLLAGTGRPEGWAGPKDRPLPDLLSRLRSVARAEVQPPDEEMLTRLLAAEMTARGFRPPLSALAEAARGLRREAEAPARLAARCADLSARGYKKPAALLRDALASAPDLTL